MIGQLITYIPDPRRRGVDDFKGKIVSIFNTNTLKQTGHGWGRKLSKPKTQKQSQGNKVNSIRNPFILKKIKKNYI